MRPILDSLIFYGIDVFLTFKVIMYIFRVKKGGLTKGSLFIAVILGIGTGVSVWKPIFDPAEKGKYEKSNNSGN